MAALGHKQGHVPHDAVGDQRQHEQMRFLNMPQKPSGCQVQAQRRREFRFLALLPVKHRLQGAVLLLRVRLEIFPEFQPVKNIHQTQILGHLHFE